MLSRGSALALLCFRAVVLCSTECVFDRVHFHAPDCWVPLPFGLVFIMGISCFQEGFFYSSAAGDNAKCGPYVQREVFELSRRELYSCLVLFLAYKVCR